MGTIGVFASAKYLENLMREQYNDTDGVMKLSTQEVHTTNSYYCYFAADSRVDIYKCSGMRFDSVQIHWSVNPDTIPYILGNCRK